LLIGRANAAAKKAIDLVKAQQAIDTHQNAKILSGAPGNLK